MDQEQKSEIEPQNTESAPEQPLETKTAKKNPPGLSRWQRFRNWYTEHKRWTIPATVFLLILITVAVVPWTRYKAAGYVIKQDFVIKVLDSASQKPVSGATVSAGSVRAQTDGNGRASLRLSAGNHSLLISKKYYQEQKSKVLVPILSQKSPPSIAVDATGRQAKVLVKNLISQKSLSGVDIIVADTSAKTDKNGEAIIVLPVGTKEQKAMLSLQGYNPAEVIIKVSDSEVVANDFTLTPAGKIYFIGKNSGKLDLMKANLDGSESKVVVAGTGNESESDSISLQSPSGKYVALLARRSAGSTTPQLYILSTADDQLLSIDSSKAEFGLAGWAGDSLIYTAKRNDLPNWQQGKSKLKAYDALSGKMTLLNQTASSDPDSDAASNYELVMISGNKVIFGKDWSGSTDGLSGKQHSLEIIETSGQNYKSVASIDASSFSVQYIPYSPAAVYVKKMAYSGGDSYLSYKVGSVVEEVSLSQEQISDLANHEGPYYFSHSGERTFWADHQNDKNTMKVGDTEGNNTKSVASLSRNDEAYGWFSDSYLIISRQISELYIMSAEGGQPIKVTNYFRPINY
jgi:hypothetical protein